MIYAVGLDTDPVFVHFLVEASRRHTEVVPINLRALAQRGQWQIHLPVDTSSFVEVDGIRILLNPHASYYYRPAAIGHLQETQQATAIWNSLVNAFTAWLECIPGLVVNRPNAFSDNGSKPLHEHHLSQLGFQVPASLTSAQSGDLIAFASQGPTIIKALSGVRADARVIDADELKSYDPRRGPVHLQRCVNGFDVRAHVVGAVVHAEQIVSGDIDYRGSKANKYAVHVLPPRLQERVVRATRDLGLTFAGWDFKVDAQGQYWCLEANPMPGYYPYDRRLGGRISRSLLALMEDASSCAGSVPRAALSRELTRDRRVLATQPGRGDKYES